MERQQVKWFTYAGVMLAASTTLTYVVFETMSVGWLRWVGFLPAIVGLVGLPVAVGIAVLKYRLYNIDVLAPQNFNEAMFSRFQEVLNGSRSAEEQAAALLQEAWEEAKEQGNVPTQE